MNISQKLVRSESKEKINFSKITCLNQPDPLVKVTSSNRIKVEPIWEQPDDFEGKMYADYRNDHPDYDAIYVRSELLKRLERAADGLNKKYQLVVRAGHRPLDIQKRLMHDVMADYKRENPTASDTDALEHARLFVSDPDTKLPPHCCGAAVDVDMFDTTTNAYVDFGSPMNEDDDISFLHTTEINQAQRANRLMLLTAMLNAGFSSYYAEWWHYSYGDQIWSWFYGKDTCLYGLINVDA